MTMARCHTQSARPVQTDTEYLVVLSLPPQGGAVLPRFRLWTWKISPVHGVHLMHAADNLR